MSTQITAAEAELVRWVDDRASEKFTRQVEMTKRIAAMPRVRVWCGRDYYRFGMSAGVAWAKSPDVQEGEIVYRKSIEIAWTWPRIITSGFRK